MHAPGTNEIETMNEFFNFRAFKEIERDERSVFSSVSSEKCVAIAAGQVSSGEALPKGVVSLR